MYEADELVVQRLREHVRSGRAPEAKTEFDPLAAAERLGSFEGRSRFSTWVCGITKMHCMNAVRKHTDLITEDGLIDPADPVDASVLKMISRAERHELVREAAAAVLDPIEQEAVYLRYEEQLPREESSTSSASRRRAGPGACGSAAAASSDPSSASASRHWAAACPS